MWDVMAILLVMLLVVLLTPIGVAWVVYHFTVSWVLAAVAAVLTFVVLAIIAVIIFNGFDFSK